LGIEQRRTPGIAEPAGDRAELIGVGRHQGAAGEKRARIVAAAEPAILGFDTHHPVGRELVIKAALHAAQKPAVTTLQAAVARKGAADMAADIEPGPVVDSLGRRIGGRLGVGAWRQVGRKGWSSKCDRGGCAEQKFLHVGTPFRSLRPSANNMASVWLLVGGIAAPTAGQIAADCGSEATTPICSNRNLVIVAALKHWQSSSKCRFRSVPVQTSLKCDRRLAS